MSNDPTSIYANELNELLAQAQKYSNALSRNRSNYEFYQKTKTQSSGCREKIEQIRKEMKDLGCDAMHISNKKSDRPLRPFEMDSLFICLDTTSNDDLIKQRTQLNDELTKVSKELRDLILR